MKSSVNLCDNDCFTVELKVCPPCKEDKVKEILSKFSISVDPITQDIVNAKTHKPTSQNLKDCSRILNDHVNTLKFSEAKQLVADCGKSQQCKDCIDAINSAILSTKKDQELQGSSTTINQYKSLDELINSEILPEISMF